MRLAPPLKGGIEIKPQTFWGLGSLFKPPLWVLIGLSKGRSLPFPPLSEPDELMPIMSFD